MADGNPNPAVKTLNQKLTGNASTKLNVSVRRDSKLYSWSHSLACRERERVRKVMKFESPTFLSFSEVGLRMVSSGLFGLGLGDLQELRKDLINGSRCCPF